ncbi:MAG: hypothetical protein V1770_03805 [bacterium]
MGKIFKYFFLPLFIVLIAFSCAFAKGSSTSPNTVFLTSDGTEVVLQVKIMQITKKGSPIICDVTGKKIYAISDSSRMCIGSGIIDKNGVLKITYNNPYRKKDKDMVYIERIYFIMQAGEEIIGYAAPDPAHPCFTGQYNYKIEPAVIDRNESIDPDKLAISFVLPFCYANTAVKPVPDGIPWNFLGPQKKTVVEALNKLYKDPK